MSNKSEKNHTFNIIGYTPAGYGVQIQVNVPTMPASWDVYESRMKEFNLSPMPPQAQSATTPNNDSKTEVISHVAIRKHFNKDNSETPQLGFYSANKGLSKRYAYHYCNTILDIQAFEQATGLTFADLPQIDADSHPARDGSPRSEKYLIELSTPITIAYTEDTFITDEGAEATTRKFSHYVTPPDTPLQSGGARGGLPPTANHPPSQSAEARGGLSPDMNDFTPPDSWSSNEYTRAMMLAKHHNIEAPFRAEILNGKTFNDHTPAHVFAVLEQLATGKRPEPPTPPPTVADAKIAHQTRVQAEADKFVGDMHDEGTITVTDDAKLPPVVPKNRRDLEAANGYIRKLACRGIDLKAGDVIMRDNGDTWSIITIAKPDLSNDRNRKAKVKINGEETKDAWVDGNSVDAVLYTIVGGNKIDRATADRKLIQYDPSQTALPIWVSQPHEWGWAYIQNGNSYPSKPPAPTGGRYHATFDGRDPAPTDDIPF